MGQVIQTIAIGGMKVCQNQPKEKGGNDLYK